MSSKKDIFKHVKGCFDRLTNKNYPAWAENMRFLLQSIDGWNIVIGEEDEPDKPAADADRDTKRDYKADCKDYWSRYREAAGAIFNACSEEVRVFLKGMQDPEHMWDTLVEKMDNSSTATGRQQVCREFLASRPVPGAPIGDYFARLSELRNQLAGTDEEISESMYKSHLLNTLPKVFEMTVKFQQNLPDATVDDVINALLEDERNRMMRTQMDAAAEALTSNATAVTKKPRGKKRCDFCNTNTHSTDRCWSKNSKKGKKQKNSNGKRDKSDSEDDDDDSDFCFHCGEPGHRSPQCPVKKKAADARQKKKKGADDKDAGSGF
jgi:hypothetical protein